MSKQNSMSWQPIETLYWTTNALIARRQRLAKELSKLSTQKRNI